MWGGDYLCPFILFIRGKLGFCGDLDVTWSYPFAYDRKILTHVLTEKLPGILSWNLVSGELVKWELCMLFNFADQSRMLVGVVT